MAQAPYPGLRPFDREEADIFFGRESHIDSMIDRLAEHRFLAVTGSSGSGKSSLVRAGLFQGLEVGLLASAGPNWRFAIMRPGERPMEALAASLRAARIELGSETDTVLDHGPLSMLAGLRERPLPGNANLLILVDQFEELFRDRRRVAREEVEAFVALLLGLRRQTDLRTYVVLTMRADFLGDCAQFDGLAEAICDSLYLCPRLSRGQIVSAIEGPALVFGAMVEPALVERIVADMGTDPDQLPLMQYVLLRLWEEAKGASEPVLRLDAYTALGGIEDGLSRDADAILDQVTAGEPGRRDATRRLFCLLTAQEGGRAVKKPAKVAEVIGVTERTLREIAAITEPYRAPGRSLLMPALTEALTTETPLEISHEALIRRWPTLENWVEDETRSAAEYRYLEGRALIAGRLHVLSQTDEFDNMRDWLERQKPNAAWANRYGRFFSLTLDFIHRSLATRRKATYAVVAALISISLPLSVFLGLSIWALMSSRTFSFIIPFMSDESSVPRNIMFWPEFYLIVLVVMGLTLYRQPNLHQLRLRMAIWSLLNVIFFIICVFVCIDTCIFIDTHGHSSSPASILLNGGGTGTIDLGNSLKRGTDPIISDPSLDLGSLILQAGSHLAAAGSLLVGIILLRRLMPLRPPRPWHAAPALAAPVPEAARLPQNPPAPAAA